MSVNRVEVTINSRQYAVLANESEDYIRRMAGHIDEKVKLVLKGGQNVMGERPIVLAALNICDEYYKCEEAGRVLKHQLQTCTDKLDRAYAEIRELKSATPQISFDEAEAEEKLKAAEEQINILKERIKELEGKNQNSSNQQKNINSNLNNGRNNNFYHNNYKNGKRY